LENLAPLPQSRASASKPWTALCTLPAPLRGKRDEVYERLLIAYSRLPFICFGILMRILIKNIYLLVIL